VESAFHANFRWGKENLKLEFSFMAGELKKGNRHQGKIVHSALWTINKKDFNRQKT
jgi:hypothetical protein